MYIWDLIFRSHMRGLFKHQIYQRSEFLPSQPELWQLELRFEDLHAHSLTGLIASENNFEVVGTISPVRSGRIGYLSHLCNQAA
jgi:hypothetical protein